MSDDIYNTTGKTRANGQPLHFSIGGNQTQAEVIYSLRRRTIEISVHRDGRVRLRAPVGTPEKKLQECVAVRERWILATQRKFRHMPPLMPPRVYENGETHLYLGRQYRLQLETATNYGVAIKDDWLYLHGPDMRPARARALLNRWYRLRALEVFRELYDRVWPRFASLGYDRPVMHIKDMTSRWGSLSVKGNMSLNLQLIKGEPGCIEYVLVHELCHLRHRNHGRQFYAMLTRYLPDWQTRERRIRDLALTCRGN